MPQAQRIQQLIRQLGSEDFEAREKAVKELVAIGTPALEPLRRACQSDDREIARRAVQCIPEIEREARIAEIAAKLKDKEPKVRAEAADSLREFGPLGKSAIPALIAALSDPDLHVRDRVLVAFWHMGPEGKAAVPRLLEILKEKTGNEDLRRSATTALGEIGVKSDEVLSVLIQILQTEGPTLRRGAVNALGQLGQHDKRVHPLVLKALNDPDNRVKSRAARAIGNLAQEPQSSLQALLGVLKRFRGYTEGDDPRYETLVAIPTYSSDAKVCVPAILELAADRKEDFSIRLSAVRSLRQLGPNAKEAIPGLRLLLEDQELPPVEDAIKAISGNGP